jgi:hypothetical protein
MGGPPKMQVMLAFELHKRRGPALDSQGNVLTANAILNFICHIGSMLIDFAGCLRGEPYDERELDDLEKAGGLDVEELLGRACRLEIVHEKRSDGRIKDKIRSVSRLDPDDDKEPEPHTDLVYWDWTLGTDPPKRISYFWDRAQENPSAKRDPIVATETNDADDLKSGAPAEDVPS